MAVMTLLANQNEEYTNDSECS